MGLTFHNENKPRLNTTTAAIVTAAVSQQSLWHECKTRITDPKTILYIEGIPVCVYLVCWALTAAVLWIARGFGLAGREEKG